MKRRSFCNPLSCVITVTVLTAFVLAVSVNVLAGPREPRDFKEIVAKKDLIAIGQCIGLQKKDTVNIKVKDPAAHLKVKRYELIFKVAHILKGAPIKKIRVKGGVPPKRDEQAYIRDIRKKYKNQWRLFMLNDPDIRHHSATAGRKNSKIYSQIILPCGIKADHIDHLNAIGPKLKTIFARAVQQSPKGDPWLRPRVKKLLQIMQDFDLPDKELVEKLSRHQDRGVRLEVARLAELKSEPIIQDGLRQIRERPGSSVANKWRHYLSSILDVNEKTDLVFNALESDNEALNQLAIDILDRDNRWGEYGIKAVDKLISYLKKTKPEDTEESLSAPATSSSASPISLPSALWPQWTALTIIHKIDWPGVDQRFGAQIQLKIPEDAEISPLPSYPTSISLKKNPAQCIQSHIEWWEKNRPSVVGNSTGQNSTGKGEEK